MINQELPMMQEASNEGQSSHQPKGDKNSNVEDTFKRKGDKKTYVEDSFQPICCGYFLK